MHLEGKGRLLTFSARSSSKMTMVTTTPIFRAYYPRCPDYSSPQRCSHIFPASMMSRVSWSTQMVIRVKSASVGCVTGAAFADNANDAIFGFAMMETMPVPASLASDVVMRMQAAAFAMPKPCLPVILPLCAHSRPSMAVHKSEHSPSSNQTARCIFTEFRGLYSKQTRLGRYIMTFPLINLMSSHSLVLSLHKSCKYEITFQK